MNISRIFIVFYLIYINQVNCYAFEWIQSAYNILKCPFGDCCNDNYVPQNITAIRQEFDANLFGQHIAQEAVLSALAAHVATKNPPKALAMSFHGLAGTGKNFVVKMIANNFFKLGCESKHFQIYTGRLEFKLKNKLNDYKDSLVEIITETLLSCPKSMFVFDEVDIMIPGVLDVLVPFLDHGPVRVNYKGTKKSVQTNNAIFIILSNTGSHEIAKTLTDLRAQGRSRCETKLADFESLIATGAFNEKGGLHRSDTISTSLIDHYVPFLPLEKQHVRQCIKAAFKLRDILPSEEQIDEAMSHVTFGDKPFDLYAKNGCKRVDQKVASIAYRQTKSTGSTSHNEL
ncbi:torsin-1A [Microplitis demolitor]|uniref:torsin-1A n=1 Tax=Microplitis demolitor TaxID=69319 RepID=UPI0004CC9F9C|nr:torsin-1A [Microplitis demolitor]